MLTAGIWDLYTMNWDRKGILLMLAVVVLWAAAPASACLLGTRHSSPPACCRAMAKDCDTPTMGADSSCCQIHDKTPAGTPAYWRSSISPCSRMSVSNGLEISSDMKQNYFFFDSL